MKEADFYQLLSFSLIWIMIRLDVYLERDEEKTNETNLSHFRKSLLFMAIIDC